MANKKISEFNINHNLSGDNILPLVASGETMIISLSGLTDYISNDFLGIKKHINPNEIVNVKNNSQYLVYGDLTLEGGIINNYGDITILNGSFINSGGTYNSSGGTMNMISFNRDTTRTVQVDNIDSSGATIDLYGYTSKTYFKVNTLLSGDTFFVCSDISKSIIGDTLFLMTKLDVTKNFVFFFDNYFYLSHCGSHDTPPSINMNNAERNIIAFIFDGEKWVSTWDNC